LLKSAQGTLNKCFIEETLQTEITNSNRFRLEIKGIIDNHFLLVFIFGFICFITFVFIVDNGFEQDGFFAGIPSSVGPNSRRYRIPTNHKFRAEQG